MKEVEIGDTITPDRNPYRKRDSSGHAQVRKLIKQKANHVNAAYARAIEQFISSVSNENRPSGHD